MATESLHDGLNEKQVTTLRFVEQMAGLRVVSGPPRPGSPLARIVELADAQQAGRIEPEVCRESVRAILIEGLTQAELEDLNP